MDKYEYSLKKKHLKQLIAKGSMEEAAALCDTIDWQHNKDSLALYMAADVYEATGAYGKAQLVLEQSYQHGNQNKRLACRIAQMALQNQDIQTAENYFEEFRMLAPDAPEGLLLEYQLATANKRPLKERIEILEDYKASDFEERWGYELAELYHQAGDQDACVRLCDEIILWFGFGPYVDKALQLKVLYAPLSEEQRQMLNDETDYQTHLSRMTQDFAELKAKDQIQQLVEDEKVDFSRPQTGQTADFLKEESIGEAEVSNEVMENVNRKTAVLFGELDSSVLFEEQEPIALTSLDKVQELQDAYDSKLKEYEDKLQEPPEEHRMEPVNYILEEEEEPEPEMDFETGETAIHHFIVSSEMPAAGLHFAQGILKQMVKRGIQLPSENTARTTAEKLNHAGLIRSIQVLLGKVLIIEQAGELSDTLIGELNLILKRQDIQLLVVLIDTEEQLNQMFARSGNFKECFSRTFIVSGYTVAELEEYAQYYALEQDYRISDKALTAIEGTLEEIAGRKDGGEKDAIESLVDRAIENSSKRSFKKMVKSLFVLLRDEEEHIYLREEDFA
ncbi:MAG: hypothetical protein IJV50_04310 [Lachnospiraceae bacterium]|nr:hypothetical protein [Lachnospiraceae bacterium]